MKVSILLASEIEHSGYGSIGLQYRRGLAAMGMDVLDPDMFGWDRLLVFSPPRAIHLGPSPRPDVVYHTMFEATPVPEAWVDILNRVGLVWVPSDWCCTLFADAGVTTPIMVAGYGYDPELYHPVDRTGRTGPLKVRAWGDVLVSRKQIVATIEAFVQADIPDATLEVKLNDSFLKTPTITDADTGEPHRAISLITDPMSRAEMVAWLHEGDVLFYLSGGEGYGLIPLEAMATGLPVIAMRQTGMLEYMQEGAVLEVPSLGLHPAPSLTAIHQRPVQIHKPDLQAAIRQLRWVADNRDAAAALGLLGYESVKHLTWDHAVRQAVTQLHEYEGVSA